MENYIDLIMVDDESSSKSVPNHGSVMHDFEDAVTKCRMAMKSSEERYQALLTKYNELENKVAGGGAQESAAPKAVCNSYVVVLVDAHSHLFKSKYMYGAESGGSQAAKLLKEAAISYIGDYHPNINPSRIQAQVYANIKGLSVDVAECRNNGNKKLILPNYPRALGGFAAGFSRTDTWFNYVDVVEEEEVENKITALFRAYVKDQECAHILLAASGSAGYARLANEHSKFAGKFTRIPGGVQDTNIYPDNTMRVFENVFEQAGIGHSKVAQTHKKSSKAPIDQQAKPSMLQAPSGIPVNSDGERIDIYLDPPTNPQWSQYEARISKNKLCTPHHLASGCENGKICAYDHELSAPPLDIVFATRYGRCHAGNAVPAAVKIVLWATVAAISRARMGRSAGAN